MYSPNSKSQRIIRPSSNSITSNPTYPEVVLSDGSAIFCLAKRGPDFKQRVYWFGLLALGNELILKMTLRIVDTIAQILAPQKEVLRANILQDAMQ